MDLLYDLSVLPPCVVNCITVDLRDNFRLLHTLSSRRYDFFPVRPRQRYLPGLAICTNQIQVTRAIGCKGDCEAFERRPGIETRFRYIQDPCPRERCHVFHLRPKNNGATEDHREPWQQRKMVFQLKFS